MDHLLALVHHLVLPAKVPSGEDANPDAIAHDICFRLSTACKHMSRQADGKVQHALRTLYASLQNSSSIHQQRLEKQALIDMFGQLDNAKVLILHVAEQNAALNIRRVDPEHQDFYDTAASLCQPESEAKVHIEVFEASAPSEAILEAEDRLVWSFPGRAVELPLRVFNDPSFQDCLASFLEQASMESLRQFQTIAHKAGVANPEVRGVADPSLITQMLMSLLEAMGSAAPLHLLEKHIRDEVNFHHTMKPWRRHPFWLVLRVSTHRHLGRLLGVHLGRFCYKLLLCMLLADLLHACIGNLPPEVVHFLLQKLCRRLAKIETELDGGSLVGDDHKHAISLMNVISPVIETAVTNAKQQFEAVWTRFKLENRRPVPYFRDWAASFDTRLELRNSLVHLDAVLLSKPKPHPASRVVSWDFAQEPSQGWVSSLGGDGWTSDRIDYNYISGTLLVNGQPRGHLPQEFFDSEDIKELFGGRPIQAYTTNKYGMTHQLTDRMGDNVVYFKVQDSRVIIRAETRFALFELIPRRIFLSVDHFDLPSELVHDCVHWLNLDTRELEIRRKPAIWYHRPGDWKISVDVRRAIRGNVELVCPTSELFRQASALFQNFEDPFRMTLYQSVGERSRGLFVHLRELKLSFVVNSKGLLECESLGAEIDPEQDAGTWHGFQSKLVVRDLVTQKRSVLVPLGTPVWQKHGVHVSVTVRDKTGYEKYEIDPVLGRLTCAPEPRLLYTKALIHALTSFVLPDSLTGRTGTEEALSILQSDVAQSWTELTGAELLTLQIIRNLAPRREYYPPEKRLLQTVTWDRNTTATIQHDAFDRVVRYILQKSDGLKALIECADMLTCQSPLTHLRLRAEFRRFKHERRLLSEPSRSSSELIHRDQSANGSEESDLVFEITEAVCNPTFHLRQSGTIHSLLESWPVVGGPSSNYARITSSLAGLLNCTISEQWGTLVSMASESTSRYQLAFRLSILAYNRGASAEALRFLSSYGILDELKTLSMPDYPSFTECQFNTCPPEDGLSELISAAGLPYMVDWAESKKENAEKQRRHDQDVKAESRRIAKLLLLQWPSASLVTTGISTNLIDIDNMLDLVTPVWERVLRNRELRQYLDCVQRILYRYEVREDETLPPSYESTSPHGRLRSTMATIPPGDLRDDSASDHQDAVRDNSQDGLRGGSVFFK